MEKIRVGEGVWRGHITSISIWYWYHISIMIFYYHNSTLLLIPRFLGSGFVFVTLGKWENPNPEGNGAALPERATGQQHQELSQGEPWVSLGGCTGSTRGCQHLPGDNSPLWWILKSIFHCISKKNTLGMIHGWLWTEIPVVLGHNSWSRSSGKVSLLWRICLCCIHLLQCFVFQSSIFKEIVIKKLFQAVEIPLGLESVVLAGDVSASEPAVASVLTFLKFNLL